MTVVFVDAEPDALALGHLYVNPSQASAVHACCCGCGGRVQLRIAADGHQIHYGINGVTLHPQIRNTGDGCDSRYWINAGRVHWTPPFLHPELHLAEVMPASIPAEAPAQVDCSAQAAATARASAGGGLRWRAWLEALVRRPERAG